MADKKSDPVVEIKIEKSQINGLNSYFKATSKQLNRASEVALSETIKWAKNQMVKRVAAAMSLQAKPFTQPNGKGTARIHWSVNKADKSARFWFGLYRISVARFNPRQVGKTKKGRKRKKNAKAGVVAGLKSSIFCEGAFLMPLKKKDGSKPVVPYQVMKRVGKKRLPIEKEVLLYKWEAEDVQKELMDELPHRLWKTLRQKLQWQTEKN